MCLILFAWNAHPDFRLVVAANRDEYRHRRSRALARWDDLPVIGGRDARAGGTWMGLDAVDPSRIAAVTNVRDPAAPTSTVRSRGALPVDFLAGGTTPEVAADDLVRGATEYSPVNLLVGDASSLWWATNWPTPECRAVADGVHGVSNGTLDSSWPKVVDGKTDLEEALAGPNDDLVERCLALLDDRRRAPDDRLPDNGVPLDFERGLSSKFVDLPGYGTRSSTVVRIARDGRGDITERRYGYRRKVLGTRTIAFPGLGSNGS
ncbi:NRDE family protein [Gordonia soli]|uniref:NRDE family protein n=1 Tax=Gordonia soli NBRC 108243 TaxID=1223545 RepID=M0QS56_9ACTN|nr:NRDE family protein [Gordonia soli]GAC70862.1 hypothetical protein GS4_42_00400 [Gordonia soli NBRC 108243]